MSEKTESKPSINVTPLIDILLVLLIIFMAISPLKPSSFKAKVPAEQKQSIASLNPHTLVVSVSADSALSLNNEKDLGTVNEPQKLVSRLAEVFRQRLENRVYAEGLETRDDLTENEKIEKTVFIKAPRDLPYIQVAKAVDTVKTAGANPIALQIDKLN